MRSLQGTGATWAGEWEVDRGRTAVLARALSNGKARS
jgi:hypothetical protein